MCVTSWKRRRRQRPAPNRSKPPQTGQNGRKPEKYRTFSGGAWSFNQTKIRKAATGGSGNGGAGVVDQTKIFFEELESLAQFDSLSYSPVAFPASPFLINQSPIFFFHFSFFKRLPLFLSVLVFGPRPILFAVDVDDLLFYCFFHLFKNSAVALGQIFAFLSFSDPFKLHSQVGQKCAEVLHVPFQVRRR